MPWLLLLVVLHADPIADGRLTTSAAGAKVAELVRKQKPNALVPPILPVTDLTTDAVWKQLKLQVVRINPDEIAGGEAFVIQGDRVRGIGHAFGGDGVTSLAVVQAGDKPILVFAFAWGSGEHRSQLAALDAGDPKGEEIPLPPVNFSFKDYSLRTTADGTVEAWAGATRVGRILAERTDGVLQVRLSVAGDLPEALRKVLR